MRKPTVENVDKWTDHYKSMAEGKFPLEDMYILNQQGRGLGLNKRGKIIYKIQKTPPIISPVAQGINQAESMVKSKGRIKRSSRKKKTHSKRINRRSRKRKTTTKKNRRKKRTTRKRKTDIFG